MNSVAPKPILALLAGNPAGSRALVRGRLLAAFLVSTIATQGVGVVVTFNNLSANNGSVNGIGNTYQTGDFRFSSSNLFPLRKEPSGLPGIRSAHPHLQQLHHGQSCQRAGVQLLRGGFRSAGSRARRKP